MMNTISSSAQSQNGRGAENVGRWTAEEHAMFLKGVEMYGKAWKKIAAMIATRTVVQVRTHAQKYFQKLVKANESGQGLSPESENLEPRLITTSIAQSPPKNYKSKVSKDTKKIITKTKPSAVATETIPIERNADTVRQSSILDKKRPLVSQPAESVDTTSKKQKYSSPAIQTHLAPSTSYLSEGSPTAVCDFDAAERLPLSLGGIAYSPFKYPSTTSLSETSLLHDNENEWLHGLVTEEPEDSVLSLHSVDEPDLPEFRADTNTDEHISGTCWGEPFDSDSFLNPTDLVELGCPF